MTSDRTSEALMTAEQIAEILQLPLSTVWRLAREDRLPCLHAGRLLRFNLVEVLEVMRQKPDAQDQAAEGL